MTTTSASTGAQGANNPYASLVDAPPPVLEIQNLVVRYGRGRRALATPPAVDDVSITIQPGETVGLVGESGSGKTTIGRAVLGLERVTSGSIRFNGRDITNLSAKDRGALGGDLRAIFQDPYSSLNPRLTVGASIAEPLRIAGTTAADATARAGAMLESVGLPADATSRYPRQFSGGQRQRIAVARALITNPSLVICDEPVSALDLSTQAQVLNLLADLRAERKLSYLFIAHDIGVVGFLAQRVVVLYRGQIMETGAAASVTTAPTHPFTQALTAASPVPRPAEQAARRAAREASGVKTAGNIDFAGIGCPFAARCPLATDLCRTERPALREVNGSLAACHYAEEAAANPIA